MSIYSAGLALWNIAVYSTGQGGYIFHECSQFVGRFLRPGFYQRLACLVDGDGSQGLFSEKARYEFLPHFLFSPFLFSPQGECELRFPGSSGRPGEGAPGEDHFFDCLAMEAPDPFELGRGEDPLPGQFLYRLRAQSEVVCDFSGGHDFGRHFFPLQVFVILTGAYPRRPWPPWQPWRSLARVRPPG